MDPQKFKTQMGDLAMGTALNAAARDYQKVCCAHVVTCYHYGRMGVQELRSVSFWNVCCCCCCRRHRRHDVITVAEAHEVSVKQFRVYVVHR